MSSETPAPAPIDATDPEELRRAVARWAEAVGASDPRVRRVGFLGKFHPEGSEEESHVDVVLVVDDTEVIPSERVSMWDLSPLPVPTQPLVFTRAEWKTLEKEGGWLARRIEEEAVWVFGR